MCSQVHIQEKRLAEFKTLLLGKITNLDKTRQAKFKILKIYGAAQITLFKGSENGTTMWDQKIKVNDVLDVNLTSESGIDEDGNPKVLLRIKDSLYRHNIKDGDVILYVPERSSFFESNDSMLEKLLKLLKNTLD